MYERILVPTDGSEHTETVLTHAMDIAKQYGATVHGLYVIDRSGVPSPEPDMREEMDRWFQERSERALTDVERAAGDADVDVVTTTVSGVPSEEIIDYAVDNDIDLIVMGTHGRTGLQHFLLGSVAEKVVRHSPVPTLMVRIGEGSTRS